MSGGVNTYIYVDGNPISGFDLYGLFSSLEACKNPRNAAACAEAGMGPRPLPKPVPVPVPIPKEQCDDKDDKCDKKLSDEFLKRLGIDAHALKRDMVPGGGWGAYNLCGCKDGRILLKRSKDCKDPGGEDTGERWK